MPIVQTTTNLGRYSFDALAQNSSSENGSGSYLPPCVFCHCLFDPDGNCCCGGVTSIGSYYCICGDCGLCEPCGRPHFCFPISGGNPGSGGSTGDDGSSGGGGSTGDTGNTGNTGTQEQINFATGINSETVSETTKNILYSIMLCAGITSIEITSTTRTPEAQALAMYNNCENLGAANQKELYANAGDQVIDVYSQGKAQNLSKDQIISLMVSKINEVGPTNVSKHCANPDELNVIDISPSSISNRSAFENCLGSNSRISKFITPPTDPVYHIEVLQ